MIFIHKKFVRQRHKLKILRLRKNFVKNTTDHPAVFSNHTFYPRFFNLTNCQCSNSKLQLIERGFKFNIQPINNRKDSELLGVDCELIANNNKLPYAEKYSIASTINNSFDNSVILKRNLQDSIAISSIKKKTTDNNIVSTRADKGNTVITISHDSYVNKTHEFLKNYDKLELDPTKEWLSIKMR